MHLLVQHPSLLMTEHGKEGDGGVVMHASYPKLLQIFKIKNTKKAKSSSGNAISSAQPQDV